MNNHKPYKKLSDAELILLYKDYDDVEALGELFNRYEKVMFSTILRMVKYDVDLAWDLLQDARKRIIEKLKSQYIEKKQFRSWAVIISKNIVRDYFRKDIKEISLSEITQGNSFSFTLEEWMANYGLIGYYEKKDIPEKAKIIIRELINELPESQQKVLIGRMFHNLGFKEIAKRENIKKTTAISRMHYALDKLRKKIETDPRGKLLLELVPRYKSFLLKKRVKPKLS